MRYDMLDEIPESKWVEEFELECIDCENYHYQDKWCGRCNHWEEIALGRGGKEIIIMVVGTTPACREIEANDRAKQWMESQLRDSIPMHTGMPGYGRL